MARVYDELRTLASRYLHHESKPGVLQTTALVHEAYLRLARLRDIEWRGKTHFLAVAATQMRRVLVDQARAEMAAKRGGRPFHVTFDERLAVLPVLPMEFLEVHQALEELGRRHGRQERVAELRLFSGLTFTEVATVLECSERTVRGDWAVARAWLARRLRNGRGAGA